MFRRVSVQSVILLEQGVVLIFYVCVNVHN